MVVRTPEPMDVAESSTVLALLSHVSRALAFSLDYRSTLRGVAQALVGPLADACVIRLADGAEAIVSEEGVQGALPGSASVLDVPIVAHKAQLGTLRLIDFRNGRDPAAVLPVAEEIALRIAVAIDSAEGRLREHRATDALQRALLPESLPSSTTYRYHAAYAPAGEESVVGGDWYDAFDLPDGRVALSIGDVAGHGLQAATVMGEVRQALRASALDPRSPAAVLERANAIINMRSRPVMVTAIFGIFDPATSTLTYATAGHPAPVLGMRDGWVATLPTSGLPLGIGREFESFDWTFTLSPGSLVALYTDGLTEYRHDVIEGERSVLDAVARQIVAPDANPALALQQLVFGAYRNVDDVATLTLSVTDAKPGESIQITCSAIPLAAPMIRHALLDFAHHQDLPETTRFELVTTVGEAVANAAEHAYQDKPGLVTIRVDRLRESLRVQVSDHGRWKPTSRREERGRGLRLIRALSSGLQILTDSNGTVIRLSIPIAAPTPH